MKKILRAIRALFGGKTAPKAGPPEQTFNEFFGAIPGGDGRGKGRGDR